MQPNVEAMTSKGLRASCLSKYNEADASYNDELTTKTFIGYSLCVCFRALFQLIINFKLNTNE